ncbi:hypothetical protein DRE_07579 [Drechslerella stenobrocha 248]|uniref:Uncharacterized protein n=1 Tax=Drechslerella stenobrocha 248 TaxID=1043628 RepID=W7HU20_9PEZI|nr:hypothetical protein DRE_07579 [Drechslerella stenobrocha 248]
MGFDCASYDFTSPDSTSTFLYCPSFPAAALFAVLFGLSTITHIVQAFCYGKLRLSWVIILGSAWETIAFGLRTAATQKPLSDGLGIPSVILIYLAPLLVNAFAYMVLGRMVWYYLVAKRVCRIGATRLTVIFVWLDIIAFLVQLAGASLTTGHSEADATPEAKADSARLQQIGLNIYMGGIGFQLFWILVFSGVAWRFRVKAVRGVDLQRPTSWRVLLAVLYFTLFMIGVRIIFRLVEFSQGIYDATLTTHEVFFYVLEAAPMLIACVTWNVFHPGRFLVGPESEFPHLSRQAKKAKKAEKKRLTAEKKTQKAQLKMERRRGGEVENMERGQSPLMGVELQ